MNEAIILVVGLMVGFILGAAAVIVSINKMFERWVEVAVSVINGDHEVLIGDDVSFKGVLRSHRPNNKSKLHQREDDDE